MKSWRAPALWFLRSPTNLCSLPCCMALPVDRPFGPFKWLLLLFFLRHQFVASQCSSLGPTCPPNSVTQYIAGSFHARSSREQPGWLLTLLDLSSMVQAAMPFQRAFALEQNNTEMAVVSCCCTNEQSVCTTDQCLRSYGRATCIASRMFHCALSSRLTSYKVDTDVLKTTVLTFVIH